MRRIQHPAALSLVDTHPVWFPLEPDHLRLAHATGGRDSEPSAIWGTENKDSSLESSSSSLGFRRGINLQCDRFGSFSAALVSVEDADESVTHGPSAGLIPYFSQTPPQHGELHLFVSIVSILTPASGSLLNGQIARLSSQNTDHQTPLSEFNVDALGSFVDSERPFTSSSDDVDTGPMLSVHPLAFLRGFGW